MSLSICVHCPFAAKCDSIGMRHTSIDANENRPQNTHENLCYDQEASIQTSRRELQGVTCRRPFHGDQSELRFLIVDPDRANDARASQKGLTQRQPTCLILLIEKLQRKSPS